MTEFNDILKLLEEHGVKYMIVGGHAVMYYSEPRYTKDMDIFVEASEENAERLYAALTEFGAPLAGLTVSDFTDRDFWYQMGRPPWRIDILHSIDGVDFADAWNNVVRGQLDGRPVNMIAKADLIRNKRALGRHIDLHDAEQLEAFGQK